MSTPRVAALCQATAALVCAGALAASAIVASAFAGTPGGAQGSGPIAYRWVDEKGVVHYGDHVPPQYSQQESSLLNSQGVEIGHLAAPKSAAEIQRDASDEQRMLQQKQRDSFLLSAYTSVKDIEQLRDERLGQLHGQRVAAEQYVASLTERLLGLQARALTYKPYSSGATAHRMPDDLAQDIVHTLNEMRSQRTALAAKDVAEATIRAQFQADIERFQQLRGASSAGQ
jgi:hypothetical protein